jgi:lipoprotein-releasing system permease protein
LARGEDMKGTLVRGIDPAQEPKVTDLARDLAATSLPLLVPGGFNVILGGELARSLGVTHRRHRDADRAQRPGHARWRGAAHPQMTVVGTFDSGHFEYDSALAHAAHD